jgi:hypothetical protein
MSFFFFYKIREQESKTYAAKRVDATGRGEEVRKGCGRVNTGQILCTPVCKQKNDTY